MEGTVLSSLVAYGPLSPVESMAPSLPIPVEPLAPGVAAHTDAAIVVQTPFPLWQEHATAVPMLEQVPIRVLHWSPGAMVFLQALH